jgi:hypothetical protein
MEIAKVIAQLRQDLANIDSAILSLERLQESSGRRRGRPPTPATHSKLVSKAEIERRRNRRPRRPNETAGPEPA